MEAEGAGKRQRHEGRRERGMSAEKVEVRRKNFVFRRSRARERGENE